MNFSVIQLDHVNAQNELGSNTVIVPVVEIFDLLQDGSLAQPYIANLTNGFDVISRVIWNLEWDSNTVDFGLFGNDPALTNGVNVIYNDASLLGNDNITSNVEFGHTNYDMTIFRDDKNPKTNVLLARWSFFKFTNQVGLLITSTKTLQIYIQDNLTGLTDVNEFEIIVQGYEIIHLDVQPIINEIEADPFPIMTDIVLALQENWFVVLAGIAIVAVLIKKVYG